MDRVGGHRRAGGRGMAGPVRRLGVLALGLIVLVTLTAWIIVPGSGGMAGPVVLAVVAAVALRGMAAGYPHARMGACNAVTLVRAALTAGLVSVLVGSGQAGWGVVAVAVVALLLDGLDGWLARREGLVSDFGARFDMEVDAALGLVLALLAIAAGKAGLWLLLLGGLRYGYVAAGVFLPWLRGDLPPRRMRKAVCVIQIAALTAILAPPVDPPLSLALAGIATALLVWSFAVDILWLWRRR